MGGNQKTLLFVGLEAEIAEILKDFFIDIDEKQLKTVFVSNAEETLLFIQKKHPVLVMAELEFPDGNGASLLDNIRQKDNKIVLVLTSPRFDVPFGEVKEDQEKGIFYILRPWDLIALKKFVIQKFC